MRHTYQIAFAYDADLAGSKATCADWIFSVIMDVK